MEQINMMGQICVRKSPNKMKLILIKLKLKSNSFHIQLPSSSTTASSFNKRDISFFYKQSRTSDSCDFKSNLKKILRVNFTSIDFFYHLYMLTCLKFTIETLKRREICSKLTIKTAERREHV